MHKLAWRPSSGLVKGAKKRSARAVTLFALTQYETAITIHKLAWHLSSGLLKGAQKGQ